MLLVAARQGWKFKLLTRTADNTTATKNKGALLLLSPVHHSLCRWVDLLMLGHGKSPNSALSPLTTPARRKGGTSYYQVGVDVQAPHVVYTHTTGLGTSLTDCLVGRKVLVPNSAILSTLSGWRTWWGITGRVQGAGGASCYSLARVEV